MKHLKHSCLILIATFIIGVTPALAQPVGGDNELSGSASFFHTLGTGEGSVNADVEYGKYMDDPSWEWGIRQAYTLNQNDSKPDVWNAVTAPFINYNFLDSNFLGMQKANTIVPYIGAFVGAVWNDDDFSGTTGPQVGVKAWVTTSAFVGLKYRYEWFFDDLNQADDVQDANHVLTVGFGYTWGGSARNNSRSTM